MPEGNSGGKLVDDLSRMGWYSGRVMVRIAYFRHACWSRIAGGGSDASISRGPRKVWEVNSEDEEM